MGLDSVEIVMLWEESLQVSIADDEATALFTPRAAIDLLAAKLGATDAARGGCLSLRAFGRIRRGLRLGAGVAREAIRPDSKLRDLVPFRNRGKVWAAVQEATRLPKMPALRWGVGYVFTPITVGDLAHWIVAHAAHALKREGEPWTRTEVRAVVRTVVTEICAVSEFSDDAHFIHEIGID